MTTTETRESQFVTDLREDLVELQGKALTATAEEVPVLDRNIARIRAELEEATHGSG